MSKPIKNRVITELTNAFQGSEGYLFVDFTGLSAGQAEMVRDYLREREIRIRVVRKSLAQKAFESLGVPVEPGIAPGPVAVVTGGTDAVGLARGVTGWIDEKKSLRLLGGMVDGAALDSEAVKRLAKSPGRAELRALIAAMLRRPWEAVAGALRAPGARVAGCLKTITERNESGEGTDSPVKGEGT